MTDPADIRRQPQPVWRRRGLRAVVLLLILGVSLWYTLGKLTWGDLISGISRANPGWIAAAVAVTFAAHLARAVRWRYLIVDGASIGLMNAFSATVIGYMMNNLIPRSGELVRPYVLAQRENRPYAPLLAAVAVERVLDMLTLMAVFLLMLLLLPGRVAELIPGYTPREILVKLALPIVVLVAALVVVARTGIGQRLLRSVQHRLPPSITVRLEAILLGFSQGITLQGSRGALLNIFWTIAIWTGYWLSVWFGLLAFGLDGSAGLGPADALTVLGATAVATAIAPTPGALGLYHAAAQATLVGIYRVPVATAAAFGVVTHGAPYLAIIVVGLLLGIRERRSVLDALRGERRDGAGEMPAAGSADRAETSGRSTMESATIGGPSTGEPATGREDAR